MTYCIAMKLDAGLVFMSDSRTNAGVDHINTFRKMTVFERGQDRVMALMTAGNLAISQAVKDRLQARSAGDIWAAESMNDAVRIVGESVRQVFDRDAATLKKFEVDFNVSIIFGGQIGRAPPQLFQVYAAGNYIEAHDENCYFQIGEAKYGKPIIDRVVTPTSTLDEAVKCAFISMDSTLRSNLSVGLPLDLLVYETNALAVTRFAHITEHNEYFQSIRSAWGRRLRQVFQEIDNPSWSDNAAPLLNNKPLNRSALYSPSVWATDPADVGTERHVVQTLAEIPND
jgi:putative proteasome-type protease